MCSHPLCSLISTDCSQQSLVSLEPKKTHCFAREKKINNMQLLVLSLVFSCGFGAVTSLTDEDFQVVAQMLPSSQCV